ncbi:glycosyltransferase [Gemmatimonadota bacterium DH-20]|uniref:Glycosyltransferase n=1 Tax=Gaopeijia maritima TaxID=3119007 RepID=A0ABU9EEH7_9BACT
MLLASPKAVDSDRVTTDRLRIVDITDFYSDTVSGGVKTYLHAKARHLAEKGVDHAVIVPGEADGVEPMESGRLHRVKGPVLPFSRAYRLLLSARRVEEILDEELPHVIELGSPFVVPRLVRRALKRRRIPLVGFYHADLVRTFAEPYVPHRAAAPLRVAARTMARRLIRSVYDPLDVTVAASPSVADELRALGVRRVRHISLGVDLDTFVPDPPGGPLPPVERPEGDRRPIALYVGRFCAEKRLDVLIDGYARMDPEERPWLVLVGGGPLHEEMAERARHIAGLVLRDYVSDRETLARLYAGADFYVAAGPGETFGLSIGEALACGLPVVSVARGAGPDRVAGSGVSELYRHGDPDDCARALARMTARVGENPADLRGRSRAWAEATLDWRLTVDRLVDLYSELVAGAEAGG